MQSHSPGLSIKVSPRKIFAFSCPHTCPETPGEEVLEIGVRLAPKDETREKSLEIRSLKEALARVVFGQALEPWRDAQYFLLNRQREGSLEAFHFSIDGCILRPFPLSLLHIGINSCRGDFQG